MYYAQTYQTKWHDCDGGGVLRPSALMVYLQETANLQCRDWNCDLDRLHSEDGLGFLLSRLMLRVEAPLRAYERIEVRTWCPPSRGLTFLRCFSVHRGQATVATAVSHWALMDLNRRTLVRVSDFPCAFPTGDLPDEPSVPRRVQIPPATVTGPVGERRIVYSDLDFNRHMNNTKYPDMICDFLPDMTGRYVSSLSLSYLREAAYGDVLTVSRAPVAGKEEAYWFRGGRADGCVCFEAEMELGWL